MPFLLQLRKMVLLGFLHRFQASGGMAAGGATGATSGKVQAETVGALRTFNQTLPPTLRDSIQSRPDDGVTELLSRQVLVRSAAGRG